MPPPDAVALYGPPAAGKDTVTAALARLDERYVHFDRLKVGTVKGNGYRYTTAAALAHLRSRGLVVYENSRYGNTYAVDSPRLDEFTGSGRIPVVHVGQVAAVTALRTGYPARWLTVLLWCPREVSSVRLRQRGGTDIAARLQAWDETRVDLATAGLDAFTTAVRTDHRPPEAAAELIHRAVTGTAEHTPRVCDPLE